MMKMNMEIRHANSSLVVCYISFSASPSQPTEKDTSHLILIDTILMGRERLISKVPHGHRLCVVSSPRGDETSCDQFN